jgi:hypothetical protein
MRPPQRADAVDLKKAQPVRHSANMRNARLLGLAHIEPLRRQSNAPRLLR